MDREPEAWETNPPGPFRTIGEVAVYGVGPDRFRLVWPDGEREVEGFDAARQVASELAGVPETRFDRDWTLCATAQTNPVAAVMVCSVTDLTKHGGNIMTKAKLICGLTTVALFALPIAEALASTKAVR